MKMFSRLFNKKSAAKTDIQDIHPRITNIHNSSAENFSSTRRSRKLKDYERVWKLADDLKENAYVQKAVKDIEKKYNKNQTSHLPPFRLPITNGLIAVSVITIFSLLTYGILTPHTYSTESRFSTLDPKEILIEDGSAIFLNKNTTITTSLTENIRAINLIEGEAVFDVAHKENTPFIVNTQLGSIKAIGTVFHVSIESQLASVTVLEGSVAIYNNNQEPKVLHSGSSINFDSDNTDSITKSNLYNISQWYRKRLTFTETPLATAIHEFNIYSHKHMLLEKDVEKTHKISGSFNSNEYQSFLLAIQKLFDLAIIENDEQILITNRHSQSLD